METLRSREVYSNQWITVREDIIRRPDGESAIYAVVDKSDFAVIIARDNDRFHLVEQFRYPQQKRCWEFPGGALHNGETFDPIATAHQELREETGLRASHMTYLGRIAPAPATCSHHGHIFLATTWKSVSPNAKPPNRTCAQHGSPAPNWSP
ncbi:NUDIX domain-containing protein [Nocardia crassostreae]|uniref:NUDIX domain-containing protein n=1 Tax=Nocardia crassostreae TaxID=53428 RepID=UPI000835F31D